MKQQKEVQIDPQLSECNGYRNKCCTFNVSNRDVIENKKASMEPTLSVVK